MPETSSKTKHTVAFIGLGVMGFPMASHLQRAGHHVTVYNRTGSKAQAWVEQNPGARSAPTPAQAALGADFVFSCVGNDDDLRSVTLGEHGAFDTMKTRQHLCRQYHRIGRCGPRTGSSGQSKTIAFYGCACFRRAIRCRKRCSDHHGWGRVRCF